MVDPGLPQRIDDLGWPEPLGPRRRARGAAVVQLDLARDHTPRVGDGHAPAAVADGTVGGLKVSIPRSHALGGEPAWAVQAPLHVGYLGVGQQVPRPRAPHTSERTRNGVGGHTGDVLKGTEVAGYSSPA